MKRGGSPRTEHPPPASLYQPHSAVSLTLFLWISLFLFTSLSSHNQLSSRSHHPPPPPQTCLYPGLWSFIQLLCWCLWFSGDMCGSLSVEALQGHRLCFFPPPLPPSSGHTVLPKGKSELSTRTHPQTGRAQSKTQLDNRSSHNIFVSEEISEQYFTFISLEIKDRVCQWIPVIRQKKHIKWRQILLCQEKVGEYRSWQCMFKAPLSETVSPNTCPAHIHLSVFALLLCPVLSGWYLMKTCHPPESKKSRRLSETSMNLFSRPPMI